VGAEENKLILCWGLGLAALCWTLGRVKDEQSQLGITAICFVGTILHGETEFPSI
jgi:hypothetical protein